MTDRSPWRVTDLANALVADVLGGVLLFTGWFIAHHTTDASRALLGTDIAVGGLVVALAGNIVWLLTGLREVGRLRSALIAGSRPASVPTDRPASARRVAVPAGTVGDGAVAATRLVATTAMTHYHRPGCVTVAGKPVTSASLRTHLARGRGPCAICEPAAPADAPRAVPADGLPV
jgi:hypothetical protein